MTIEITVAKSGYQYRLRPGARIIERRKNKSRARWQPWRLFDTHEQAKAALLALREGNDDD